MHIRLPKPRLRNRRGRPDAECGRGDNSQTDDTHSTHPGGAISGGGGYISAGIIARDLGLELWWKAWDAAGALGAVPAAA